MERGKFYQTRRGQASALLRRDLRRFLVMMEQQPQSKNISAADAIAFQKAVLAQLEARHQFAFTGPLFLQLEFFNRSKTPAAIYKLPKNYLDLLEKPRPDSGIDRSRLLYRNDRQVKALIVRYHLDGPFEKPMIWVQAEPFRDFLADVELVERIGRDDFEDDGDWWRSPSSAADLEKDPFEGEEDWDDNEFDRLIEFEREKDSWLRVLSNDAFEAQWQMMRRSAQEAHLRRTDRFTCRGVLSAFQNSKRARGLPAGDMMTRLATMTRDMTLRAPFVLELHHAPRREGDSDAFRAALRSALEDFKAKHRFLFPLSSLMNVTVLMVPPEGGGKDLDNLARLILPALHEIWMPPSHIVHTFKTENIKDEGIRSYWEAARAELPKEPKHSITEYRVFELPRFSGDPNEGFVRLAVGEGLHPVRFREEIEAHLDKWRARLER